MSGWDRQAPSSRRPAGGRPQSARTYNRPTSSLRHRTHRPPAPPGRPLRPRPATATRQRPTKTTTSRRTRPSSAAMSIKRPSPELLAQLRAAGVVADEEATGELGESGGQFSRQDELSQWLTNYEAEAATFQSFALFATYKLRQAELLSGAKRGPTALRTMAACQVLGGMRDVLGRFKSLIGGVGAEVARSIYVDWDDRGLSLAGDVGDAGDAQLLFSAPTYYERCAEQEEELDRLRSELSAANERHRELSEQFERERVGAVTGRWHASETRNAVKQMPTATLLALCGERLADSSPDESVEGLVQMLRAPAGAVTARALVATFQTLDSIGRADFLDCLPTRLTTAEQKRVAASCAEADWSDSSDGQADDMHTPGAPTTRGGQDVRTLAQAADVFRKSASETSKKRNMRRPRRTSASEAAGPTKPAADCSCQCCEWWYTEVRHQRLDMVVELQHAKAHALELRMQAEGAAAEHPATTRTTGKKHRKTSCKRPSHDASSTGKHHPPTYSLRDARNAIAEIYEGKMVEDALCCAHGVKPVKLDKFIHTHMAQQFGLDRLAVGHLTGLVQTAAARPEDPRCLLFTKLLGLFAPASAPAQDEDDAFWHPYGADLFFKTLRALCRLPPPDNDPTHIVTVEMVYGARVKQRFQWAGNADRADGWVAADTIGAALLDLYTDRNGGHAVSSRSMRPPPPTVESLCQDDHHDGNHENHGVAIDVLLPQLMEHWRVVSSAELIRYQSAFETSLAVAVAAARHATAAVDYAAVIGAALAQLGIHGDLGVALYDLLVASSDRRGHDFADNVFQHMWCGSNCLTAPPPAPRGDSGTNTHHPPSR